MDMTTIIIEQRQSKCILIEKGNAITYVPDTEHNRENPKLGRRLDKFLVSEDLNIKETEILHISDNYYKTNLTLEKEV